MVVVHEWLVVVVFFGDWGVFVLVMAFKEVMLTSPPELAHCAPPPPPTEILLGLGSLGTYFLIVDLISRYA